MGDAEENQKRLWELGRGLSSTTEGVVVSQDWDNRLVTVNVGGTSQVVTWDGDAPWPGDTVRIVYAGLRPFCRAVWGAPNGEVKSVAAPVATVLGDDGKSYTYPYVTVPTVGWRVAMSHAHRLIVGRYSAEPAASEFIAQPAPPGGGTGGGGVVTRTFYPVETGNYRSGSWTGGPLSISDSRSAFLFYGTQIADTIPDSAAISAMTVTLAESYDYVPGVASRLGTHGYSVRPGTPPGLSGVINVTGGGVIDIGAYAGSLQTGAAFGLGFPAAFGYREFVGAPSGYITVTYST